MRIIKKILLFLLTIFVLIQFIRPEKNISPTSDQEIKSAVNIPDTVEVILKKSCYDCHSNNTRYPWYAEIQPFAWFLADHVKDGRKHLNFNELGSLPARRQRSKYREIEEVMEEGSMPLDSYTLLHNDAKLTESEKQILIKWAESSEDSLNQKRSL